MHTHNHLHAHIQADPIIDEEHLEPLFAQYGEVLDITIKKHNKDDKKEQSGYGFALCKRRRLEFLLQLYNIISLYLRR
ncbi:hypothetical protein EON63_13615 [archaeon]|nr:MAG: hypothetical protein EON63_13615 [archaeon]